ncbi:hypothetical protein NDU88_005985 [Pleurodeles waltl]|uniref:Uncharacterized protein n=1 Tax=Pleurodeles waltl TaxID=8319 RepID=A0AAV7QMQ0_PLEWA|nr:hypothetical protein NDU88_005985 [Pleurodeles waltl]
MTCSPPVKKAVKAKLVKTRGRAACASYSNAALPKVQILPVDTMVKEAPSQGRACSKVPAAIEPGSDRNAACEDVASNILLKVPYPIWSQPIQEQVRKEEKIKMGTRGQTTAGAKERLQPGGMANLRWRRMRACKALRIKPSGNQ